MNLAAVALLVQFFATNSELGYRFTLPEGFAPFPAGRTQADILDCWTEPLPAAMSGALVMCVQRMHAVLPRDAMTQEDLHGAAQLISYKWKGFDVQGLRTDTTQDGLQVSVFVAQIPLRKEAVQIVVAGPRDQSSRMEAIMTSTLATLEGETNWLTSAERSSRLGQGVGAMMALILLVAAVRILRRRRTLAA